MHILGRNKQKGQPVGRRRPIERTAPVVGQNRTFSYHANRSASDMNVGRTVSPVEERNNSRSRFRSAVRHTPVVVAVVVIFLCLINEFTLSNSPKIVPLASDSSNVFLHDTSVYQQAAARLFASSVYNRNKLTVDTAGISKNMKQEFPELADISITLPILGHRPVVYIQPSDPAIALVSHVGDTFLLDINGRVLMRTTSSSQVTQSGVVSVVDQSGLQVTVGRTVLPSTTVDFIQTVASQLSAQHIRVKNIVLPAAGSEVDVYLSGASYYGRFNLQQGDALQQVGAFIAVNQKLSSQGRLPHEYIDVRVDGRVYYK